METVNSSVYVVSSLNIPALVQKESKKGNLKSQLIVTSVPKGVVSFLSR